MLEAELHGALGEVPADGADGADGRGGSGQRMKRGGAGPDDAGRDACSGQGVLREFQAEVLRLHDARRGEQARGASDEDGLGVAVAEGLELAQPSGENGRDAVERKLGVNAQETLGLARGEVHVGVVAQAALEVGKFFGGKREADGEGVAAEASEEVGAGLDGSEEREAIDGAAGAVGDAFLRC